MVLLVLTTGCFNFERRVADCFDGGRCLQMVDAGRDPFVPLDAGHFCADDWCWESPFPHGTRLNAVAAFGIDSVVVAGEQGMLAELRDGRWTSFQSLATPDDLWRKLWGTGPDDVFLAGSTRIWRRTDAGWSRGLVDNGDVWNSVTGSRLPGGQVFFGDSAGKIVRYNRGTNGLQTIRQLDGGVLDLEVAHSNELFALAARSNGGAHLVRPGGELVSIDAGVFAMFGNDSNLWLAGTESFSVDAQLQFTPLVRAVNTGTGASSPVRVVTDEGIETLTGTLFGPDRTQQGVRAIDAAAGAIWAVGEGGLVLRSTSQSQWVDPTQSSLRDRVRALVAFGPDLVAVTDVGLLVRSTDGWISRLSGARFLDGVAFQNRLYVLRSDNRVLSLNSNYVMEDVFTPGATLARHLWVTAGGTVVLVAVNSVFVKSPAATEFSIVTPPVVGGVAIGGAGDVVRVVTGAGDVVQLDFADQSPEAQKVPGLSIRNCTALTRFATGWAFGVGGRAGVETAVEVVGDDDSRRRFPIPLAGSEVKAFAPSSKGVFAAVRGIAEIPVLGSMPGGEVPLLPTRVTNELETVIVWRGRLFAAGEFGTIIQGPVR
ncbi:MAG: hypothetical protein Q8N26_33415 [Myxococcales bacterium]|nr:hypothetical protein [Myxococcales bacterium]